MRARGRRNGTIAAGVALTALALSPSGWADPERAGAVSAGTPGARYALANGCFGLRSQALGRFVGKRAGGVYRAVAGSAGAERFRLKATDLGLYLLYGPAHDFFAVSSGPRFSAARRASPAAEWEVEVADGAFRLRSRSTGKVLSAVRGGGLTLVDPAIAGSEAKFDFERTAGCIDYPEIGTGAVGSPARGLTSYDGVEGYVDAHVHWSAFEFLGGRAHCGRPWHRYGVEFALVDCPDHFPNGAAAVLENAVSEDVPVGTHDPHGWSSFIGWPRPESLTHEQTYYKWVERAWKAGLRIMVNDAVENGVLCEVYPLKRNSCDEMKSARLQIQRMHELERYIDAQSGGPGKGWMRIVADPFEARRVVNDGKLAVIMGMENSRPFGCRIFNGRPLCDKARIDRELDDMHRRGLRSFFPIHKFDNALGGVRFDSGTFGIAVNYIGSRYETGRWFQVETCKGKEADNQQLAHNDVIGAGLAQFLPPGQSPVPPAPPHCNPKGLTPLGEYVIRRMIAKKMIVEPDHMSVQARNRTLSMLEARGYSGVIASHSWSDPLSFPRFQALGGIITPITSGAPDFIAEWRRVRRTKSKRRVFGFGYGADSNGLHAQPGPRPAGVTYPFKSFDGRVTLHRQRSGSKVYDVNTDGVAHYGLHADWIEDLRRVGGPQVVADLARGAEAYLQMWERAEGVAEERCRGPRARFTRRGLGRQRLRVGPESLLREAGQPASRNGRAWRWCVRGTGPRRGRVMGVFTTRQRVGLVASTARGHKARGIGRGARSRRLRGKTRAFGRGIRIRRAGRRTRIVYGVRRRRVRYVAVADRAVLASKRRLGRYLRLAGLR